MGCKFSKKDKVFIALPNHIISKTEMTNNDDNSTKNVDSPRFQKRVSIDEKLLIRKSNEKTINKEEFLSLEKTKKQNILIKMPTFSRNINNMNGKSIFSSNQYPTSQEIKDVKLMTEPNKIKKFTKFSTDIKTFSPMNGFPRILSPKSRTSSATLLKNDINSLKTDLIGYFRKEENSPINKNSSSSFLSISSGYNSPIGVRKTELKDGFLINIYPSFKEKIEEKLMKEKINEYILIKEIDKKSNLSGSIIKYIGFNEITKKFCLIHSIDKTLLRENVDFELEMTNLLNLKEKNIITINEVIYDFLYDKLIIITDYAKSGYILSEKFYKSQFPSDIDLTLTEDYQLKKISFDNFPHYFKQYLLGMNFLKKHDFLKKECLLIDENDLKISEYWLQFILDYKKIEGIEKNINDIEFTKKIFNDFLFGENLNKKIIKNEWNNDLRNLIKFIDEIKEYEFSELLKNKIFSKIQKSVNFSTKIDDFTINKEKKTISKLKFRGTVVLRTKKKGKEEKK